MWTPRSSVVAAPVNYKKHLDEAARLDPNHPGALHVLGVWNAEVMRLSGIERGRQAGV